LPLVGEAILELIEQDCFPGGSRQNLKTAESMTDWGKATLAQRYLLTDAQTSGGLLLCVAPGHLDKVMKLLRTARTACAVVIGSIERSKKPRIRIVSNS
jgi:selenide,water dikinase